MPKSATALPNDVLELLGRSPLGNRHQLQLLRLGRRLLLVSVTPDSAETLAEVTDTDEVNHLTGLCRQEQTNSITNSFRQVLQQLGTQPSSRSRRSRRADRADAESDSTARPTSLRTMRELS
jgi:flagellar biogenesis protein FliO